MWIVNVCRWRRVVHIRFVFFTRAPANDTSTQFLKTWTQHARKKVLHQQIWSNGRKCKRVTKAAAPSSNDECTTQLVRKMIVSLMHTPGIHRSDRTLCCNCFMSTTFWYASIVETLDVVLQGSFWKSCSVDALQSRTSKTVHWQSLAQRGWSDMFSIWVLMFVPTGNGFIGRTQEGKAATPLCRWFCFPRKAQRGRLPTFPTHFHPIHHWPLVHTHTNNSQQSINSKNELWTSHSRSWHNSQKHPIRTSKRLPRNYDRAVVLQLI